MYVYLFFSLQQKFYFYPTYYFNRFELSLTKGLDLSIFSKETETDIVTAEKENISEPSQYNVIVHNNDFTSYEEVILILSQAFEMSHGDALIVASTVDSEGKGICGTYSKEIADMKLILVDTIKKQLIQIMPNRAREILMLKFTVEKA